MASRRRRPAAARRESARTTARDLLPKAVGSARPSRLSITASVSPGCGRRTARIGLLQRHREAERARASSRVWCAITSESTSTPSQSKMSSVMRHSRCAARCRPSSPRYRLRSLAPRAGNRNFGNEDAAGRADRTISRSASRTASSTSCVTSKVVTGRRSTSIASSSRSRAASAASSEANGSSRMSRSGSTAKARASATRRAKPSDSSPGKWARCAVNSRPQTTPRASRRRHPAPPAARCPPRVRHGSRRGSWNTMPSLPARAHDSPSIVSVEAGDDPQHRGLAASGRTDQRRDLAMSERERTSRSTSRRSPEAATIGFPRDRHFKQAGAASGMRVVQRAAPGKSRSPA